MKPNRLAIVVVSVLSLFIAVSRGPGAEAGPGRAPNGASARSATGGPTGSPAAAPSDWQSAVQRQIAEQEYEVTWQASTRIAGLEAAWQAPNRAHNLRTYFAARGIRVVPRTEAPPSWEWGLEWVGYGRGGQSWRVAPATLEAKAARVDYQRDGAEEWYENSPMGLKQGFVLPAPPEGMGRQANAEPVPLGTVGPGQGRGVIVEGLIHVDLSLTGTLRPVISEDGLAIDFEAPGGARVIHYAALKVTDGRGAALPAWMEGFVGSTARGIRIVIDATGAIYPVTIDPLATSPAWTAVTDQNTADFGYSVSTAGDVNGDGYSDVIVGAPHYDNDQLSEGRAYVYLGSASGPATTPSWMAEGDGINAEFGLSVATAGDVNGDGYSDIIVGAPGYSYATGEGRVYGYYGSAAGLSISPSWTMETGTWGGLGTLLASAGDVNGDGYSDIIVSAPLESHPEPNEGRVYVYLGSPGGLLSAPSWTLELNLAYGFLGSAVAAAGDVNGDGYSDVIVGQFICGNPAGCAYVYLGSAGGLASTPAWTAHGTSDSEQALFGLSVATAGDVNGDGYSDVIVGSMLDYYSRGRAYIYLGSATGLATTAARTIEGSRDWVRLSYSVAPAGDVNGDGYSDIILGADYNVYVYLGAATGLATAPIWQGTGSRAGGTFFYNPSIHTAGDVNGDGYSDIIVGVGDWRWNGNDGRVDIYLGSASALSPVPNLGFGVAQEDAKFGQSVATAGDVNGDGYADIIVGAPYFDNGLTDQGAAWVYTGTATGVAWIGGWKAVGDQAGARFGFSVGTAGDTNGDGYSDVVIGAPFYNNGQQGEGRSYVYLGAASGLPVSPAWTAEGDLVGAWFGWSVGTAGDMNGDGRADVIVGAPGYSNDQTGEGRAVVFPGMTSGPSLAPSWMAEGDQVSASFGYSVATAGDVNGDGYSDVIVGAHLYDNGQADEGRAYVYLGAARGLAPSASWTTEGNQAGADFGISVATAGDVNGDGYSDVIVGADNYTNDQSREGRAYVYLGSASGLAPLPAWTAEGNQASAHFGLSVATAGDVNGDGYADVIVSADGYDNGEGDEGRAYVHLGSASGLPSSPAWTSESDQLGAVFGFSVATAGDVNGDGYADVIVGAPFYDGGAADSGNVFIYHGNASTGLPLKPAQKRSGDVVPIAPLGMSQYQDSFRLGALLRSPFGRGRARLEWEVKPLGTLFNGTSLGAGGWTDLGTGGTAGSEAVTGLQPSTPYHWRLRVRYSPVTTPFASASRWVTVPWNGWQEADLRTLSCLDADGDGYGVPGQSFCPKGGAMDCLDTNASVYPGAPQICDGFNNDCNSPYYPMPPADEEDLDHDGWYICSGDCADGDAATYPGAPETNDGRDNQCPGNAGYGVIDEVSGNSGFLQPGDRNSFCWTAQPQATSYEVVRSTDPGFRSGCSYQVVVTGTCWSDPATPTVGQSFYYLVRALAPSAGSYGQDGSGLERSAACLIETACSDGVDNDGDLLVDCADSDCLMTPACEHTFAFTDTPGDDVAPTALYQFFAGFQPGGSDYILFQINEPNLGVVNAWCSENAAFYHAMYLAYATSGAYLTSEPGVRWYRNYQTGMQWVGPDAGQYANGFGYGCGGGSVPYVWCSQIGLGGLPTRTVNPGQPNPSCEIYDPSISGCGNGSWSLTIRIAPTRQAACGF